jgi:hypothetical protein
VQPKTGTLPLSHTPATVPVAYSKVPAQQARSPSPPQWDGLKQCVEELSPRGFALPPHKQLPVQPLSAMRPLAHDLPSISSPPQQARSPSSPQCIACTQ